MNNISIYLERFKSVGLKDVMLKKTVVEILKKNFQIEVEQKDISIKDGTITIKTSPILKSEIFINREKIKSAILAQLGSSNLENIR